jgi:hypothetical protein
VEGRHKAVVTALIDLDWWQDKAARRAFIRFGPAAGGASIQPVTGSFFSKARPELGKLIEGRPWQVEAAK